MRWQEGYVDAEISLTSGTAASSVSLFVQISPTTTMTLEPAASRDLGCWKGCRLVCGTVHPASVVDLSRGNLSNSGWTPPLPPEISATSVVELVNALL